MILLILLDFGGFGVVCCFGFNCGWIVCVIAVGCEFCFLVVNRLVCLVFC